MMPKGGWLKQNWPCGVMKVVRRADSVICQSPELASNLENTVAPL